MSTEIFCLKRTFFNNSSRGEESVQDIYIKMIVKMSFTLCVVYLDRKIFLKSNSFFQVFQITILLRTVSLPYPKNLCYTVI